MRLSNRLATYAIIAYQHSLSLVLGPRCRFYPSCSEYAKECFTRFGFVKALGKTGGRLARCHPLHPGGIDLP